MTAGLLTDAIPKGGTCAPVTTGAGEPADRELVSALAAAGAGCERATGAGCRAAIAGEPAPSPGC